MQECKAEIMGFAFGEFSCFSGATLLGYLVRCTGLAGYTTGVKAKRNGDSIG